MGLGVVGILDGSWGHLSSVPSESRWVDSTVRTMHFKFLTGNSDVKHICLSIIGLLKTFMCDPMLTTRFIARFQRETLYRTPHHVLLLFFNPSSPSIPTTPFKPQIERNDSAVTTPIFRVTDHKGFRYES
jgi:hypothetical protein